MTLAEKIEKARKCAHYINGRCTRDGYPPFDCGICSLFKKSWLCTYQHPTDGRIEHLLVYAGTSEEAYSKSWLSVPGFTLVKVEEA